VASLCHDLCVSAQDGDDSRRRARLRQYLAPTVTVYESFCRSEQSEERIEKTETLPVDRAVERVDNVLRYLTSVVESNPTGCELYAAGSHTVRLSWLHSELTRISSEVAYHPCIPD
jgi:hypothetical protein